MNWIIPGITLVVIAIGVGWKIYTDINRRPNLDKTAKSVAVLREENRKLHVRMYLKNYGKEETSVHSIEFFCGGKKITPDDEERDRFPIQFNPIDNPVQIWRDFRNVEQAKMGGFVTCIISYKLPNRSIEITIPITPPSS